MKKFSVSIFVLYIIIVILFRILVLLKFSFIYVDSDQSIMWEGLLDYSRGIFHEPRFYGQSYNTMIESLFAVPLFKLGIPPYKALPIVTSIMALFPYFLISILALKKNGLLSSLAVLSIPLLLPTEYAFITSLPRGFVTGIFVASFGLFALFSPKNKAGFFAFGFFMVLGYSTNANSVILTIPCLLYLFLLNKKNKQFYYLLGTGVLIAAAIHFYINSFYLSHPFYNLHKFSLTYSFDLLLTSLSNIDIHLNNVTPVFWKQGFILLLLFLLAGILLVIKQLYNIGLVLLFIPFLVIFTFGFNKIHNGTDSVFFSLSRMYLAIPVLIALFMSFIKIKNSKFTYLFLILSLAFFFLKPNNLDASINDNVRHSKKHIITVSKIKNVLSSCKKINSLSEENNIDLIVIVNHFLYDFIDYGCATCYNNFPKTLRPAYERRTWRLIEDEEIVYKNILIIDKLHTIKQSSILMKNISLGYIIFDNQLKTMDLLEVLNIKVRTYKEN